LYSRIRLEVLYCHQKQTKDNRQDEWKQYARQKEQGIPTQETQTVGQEADAAEGK